MTSPIYIIAEAGVNHNGDRDLAFKLVDAAIESNADAVKFQVFKAKSLVTENTAKAKYQQKTTKENESQHDMLARLELSYDTYLELNAYCKKNDINFMSTAFDSSSLDFLVNDVGLKTLKISSGEITNGPLLLAHAQTGCDLIVSTGMATLDEIEDALGVIAFGFLYGESLPDKCSCVEFKKAYSLPKAQQLLQEKVTLLHCTTEYPAPIDEINLNAMLTVKNAFHLNVGYSDHSKGITIPVMAAALGAKIIEKHFTLDKTLPGPDHAASLEPGELREMVGAIRTVEQAFGSGIKIPMPSEINNKDIARKSIIAAKKIKMGEVFTEENITIKRPGTGISPMQFWDILGKKSLRDFSVDEIIS